MKCYNWYQRKRNCVKNKSKILDFDQLCKHCAFDLLPRKGKMKYLLYSEIQTVKHTSQTDYYYER